MDSINLLDKRYLITGGKGFLGSVLVKKLIAKGVEPENIVVPGRDDCDLRQWSNCVRAVNNVDIVIHLAARVGGIGFNMKYPAELFYDNAIMGIQLLEASRREGIMKFVGIGTVCSYPKFTPIPFREENLWEGYPEETNSPYGIAKKILLVQEKSYWMQYGFKSIYLIPVNLYGPGDYFNLEDSHVIPALIMKFTEAKIKNLDSVTVWGSGSVSREFLYVDDAAEGILLATEKYDKPAPVNLGTSEEIVISDLVDLIKDKVGFQGEIIWDKSKPDGQPRRKLDTSRALSEFGFKAKTDLNTGLQRTIDWYLDSINRKHYFSVFNDDIR